jgi:hypothetical protein
MIDFGPSRSPRRICVVGVAGIALSMSVNVLGLGWLPTLALAVPFVLWEVLFLTAPWRDPVLKRERIGD